MSRDLGYTSPPINIIKYNYPKKHDYRLKLRIYNHFNHLQSKDPYIKVNLKKDGAMLLVTRKLGRTFLKVLLKNSLSKMPLIKNMETWDLQF